MIIKKDMSENIKNLFNIKSLRFYIIITAKQLHEIVSNFYLKLNFTQDLINEVSFD